MSNTDIWEAEYRKPRLVTGSDVPSEDVKRFLKWLRKSEDVALEKLRVLDLGSGLGKHAHFLAERGSAVTGLEIAPTALRIAKQRVSDLGLTVDYRAHDIGLPLPFTPRSFDLVLDVLSSNSLTDHGRATLVAETARILTPNGYLFLKTLSKDDKHAQTLLATHPGPEPDTYVMPGLGLTERVFARDDLLALYQPHFTVRDLHRKSSYSKFDGRTFKRTFWTAYLQCST